MTFLRAVLCIALVAAAGTQLARPWKWDPSSDRRNRYEGLVSLESANPEFELLSFTGAVEPFPAKTDLKVAFYLPEDAPVLLLAQELQDDKYYRMEAKSATWKPGSWNTFEPWDTAAVIDAEAIPRSNIGVVVYLSANMFASGPVAPAFVYHTASSRQTTAYSVVVRARSTVARVRYTVTGAGTPPQSVTRTIEGDFIRGTPIDLDIDAKPLREGPQVLTITCVPIAVGATPIERRYTFHHKR